MKRRPRTFDCPHCGHAVSAGALACPECGSDSRSGWSEDAGAWAGDLPEGYGDEGEDDEDFDYEEFLRREGLADGGRPSRRDVQRARLLVVIAVLVVCVLLWQALR